MTDMNGFNPDKKLNAQFSTSDQRNSKKTKGASPTPPEANPTGDPYADLKMDPSRMLDLLAAQGQVNQIQAQLSGNANGIERAMEAFASSVSPERHSLMSRMLEQTYQNEFGKKPSPALLQEILDNYLVGLPVVQQA